jgi:NAD(P)-dependent dehydrogenase (short-subunit alcohol dehydrogenase family)
LAAPPHAGVSAIFLADKNPVYLARVSEECQSVSPNSTFRAFHKAVDISVDSEVVAMLAEAVSNMGGLDYCCNAAGILEAPDFFADIPTSTSDKTMGTNARGMFLCIREQVKAMRVQTPKEGLHGRPKERGSIVNIASVAAILPLPTMSTYSASKHAVVGLTVNAGKYIRP